MHIWQILLIIAVSGAFFIHIDREYRKSKDNRSDAEIEADEQWKNTYPSEY